VAKAAAAGSLGGAVGSPSQRSQMAAAVSAMMTQSQSKHSTTPPPHSPLHFLHPAALHSSHRAHTTGVSPLQREGSSSSSGGAFCSTPGPGAVGHSDVGHSDASSMTAPSSPTRPIHGGRHRRLRSGSLGSPTAVDDDRALRHDAHAHSAHSAATFPAQHQFARVAMQAHAQTQSQGQTQAHAASGGPTAPLPSAGFGGGGGSSDA